MKKQINLHESKIWAFLYPLYAQEIVFGKNYESLAQLISGDFHLTPQQWEAVLNNYEYTHSTIMI